MEPANAVTLTVPPRAFTVPTAMLPVASVRVTLLPVPATVPDTTLVATMSPPVVLTLTVPLPAVTLARVMAPVLANRMLPLPELAVIVPTAVFRLMPLAA